MRAEGWARAAVTAVVLGLVGIAACGDEGSRGTPSSPTCGNGVVEPPESCDDGVDNGAYGHCGLDCAGMGPACGNGIVEEPEGCDDGADNGAYGHCALDCAGMGPGCGNGVLEAPERCDEGPDNGAPGHCSADCSTPGASCGDGVVEAPEACDDGADNGLYGFCAADCTRFDFPFSRSPSNSPEDWVPSDPCARDDWLAKYLAYRRRFTGDGTAAFPGFLSVGTEPGESIPASRREPDTSCAGHWAMTDCPRPDLPDAHGRYAWGDATIWLGAYLELLATEYAVLARYGVDTTTTELELYHALSAFNRLDEAAEESLGYAPSLDGFFQRDDVPIDFYLRGSDYRFPRADGYAGYECISSTADCPPLTLADGSFESQDQVIGLLHGLALVSALVPDTVEQGGMALRYEARAVVHRMVAHLRDDGWRVVGPNGDNPPDEWGGDARGFSDQLAKAANAICGTDFGVSDYRDIISNTVGTTSFTGLVAIWDQTFNYNRTMVLRLVAVTGEWDAATYRRRALEDNKDLFALSYALLQQTDAAQSYVPWRIESLLASAPCGGPCTASAGCEEPLGWQGEHRFMGPGDRFGSPHWSGEFNGLDYLVLHNLYLLLRPEGYAQQVPPPDGGSCESSTGIGAIVAGAGEDGMAIDPTDPCLREDLALPYCGRSLADWLDSAYRAEASIFIAGRRLRCEGAAPCVLEPTASVGSDGPDLVLGTSGPDSISGGEGADCLYGLGGDDVMEGGAGLDELHGGEGNDTLYGALASSTSLDEPDVLHGDEGDDELHAGAGDDELRGGDGSDRLYGGGGRDVLAGEAGDDWLDGGAGEDTLRGGPDDDTLYGGSEDDSIWGEAGRDKLDGGSGNDRLRGNEGDDMLVGGGGDDTLIADTGLDRLCGMDGDDTLWGGWDGDECLGAGGILGTGSDAVNGCTDGSASASDCSALAFDLW